MEQTSSSTPKTLRAGQIKWETVLQTAALGVEVKRLSSEAKLPTKETRDIPDAGWDLYSNMNVRVPGGGKMGIKTGIALAIPENWYGSIRAKSGIAASTPLLVDAGVIDPGYRGEIIVVVANNSDYPYDVLKGTKIAQILFEPVFTTTLTEVKELSVTDRGAKGFGSTGV